MAATIWNPENVSDVAESVGINNLKPEVRTALSRDVEYRLSQVIEEANKFMKHGKRTVLWSQDVAQALRTCPENIFYWPLAGIRRCPALRPQNPTSLDSRNLELLHKGPNANPNLAAMANIESTITKPQVKHVLSQELTLYFEKVCKAVLDEQQDEYRSAGLASIQNDPGLHQLVPYFVQFVAEKVTHNLKDLFVLTQMMNVTYGLVRNSHLHIEPYVASMIPSVLTCLIGRNLGSGIGSLDHFDLRDLAWSILAHLCRKYAKSSKTLKPRVARSCLKNFLDPKKPFGTHYGAILGLRAAGGVDAVRVLIVPNLKEYEALIREELVTPGPRQAEAQKVLTAILNSVKLLEDESMPMMNGHTDESVAATWRELNDKVGEVVGEVVASSDRLDLAKLLLECF